jgi:hypothetical protein
VRSLAICPNGLFAPAGVHEPPSAPASANQRSFAASAEADMGHRQP